MSSRFYRPLEEEANDPAFDEAVPFEEAPAAYDTPGDGESPFQPPPSVAESKATKPEVNPFDDVDPRLKEIDDEIRRQPRSIGGIIAAFSPSGDRRMTQLMAQRRLLGNEVHGDMVLRGSMARQLAAANARAQAAETAARARMYASDQSLTRGLGVAGINAGSRENVGAGNAAARVKAAEIGAGARTGAAQIAADARTGMPHPAPKPVKAPVDPLVAQKAKEIQVAIAAYDKALLKDQTGDAPLDDNKRQLFQTRKEMAQIDLDQLYKKGAVPSAAAPAAPAKPSAPTATGPNGEKIMFNGTEWVPVS